METNLNLFYNEEANVTIRTQQVNNEPWFVAKDVANALDIAWSGATLSNIPDDWQGMMSFNTPCGNYQGGGLQQLRSSTKRPSTNSLSVVISRRRIPSSTGWQVLSSPKSAKPASTGSRARRSACGSNNNASACPFRSTARSSTSGNSG